MNIKTITFDADVYQLVPKENINEMLKIADWLTASANLQQTSFDEPLEPASEFDYNLLQASNSLRLLLAAPQPEPLSPWRDIESAPKDGSLVLVGFWRDGEAFYDFDFLNDGIWQLYFDRAEHYQIGGGNISPEKAPYTHWMPLPQAPEVGK